MLPADMRWQIGKGVMVGRLKLSSSNGEQIQTHHVRSSLAMVLASEISLSITIARLQVRRDSALDCLCRHFDCCFLI